MKVTLRQLELGILTVIIAAYLGIATLYAIKTPAWQVPDEPAHYNYVRQVATNGCCPTIQPGDWNNDYLEQLKANQFDVSLLGQFNTIQYEDHQPPLYYLIAAPIYSASGGNLTLLRLLSVLLGAGVVVMAWLVVRTVFPDKPYLALAAAAFVAFLPQHVAMMAGVENDSLGEFLVGLVLFASVIYLGNGAGENRRRVHPAILGVLLGLTFLTKLTAMLPMIPVVGLTLLLKARQERWPFVQLLRQGLWVAFPALVMGIPFWIRNIVTYGGIDFLAQSAHDRVVVGQLRTSDYIAQVGGVANWLGNGIKTTFDSFWGQFGWMGVPMTDTIYLMLFAFTVFVAIGLIIAIVRWRKQVTPIQRDAVIILIMTAFFALVQHLGYNAKFVQFQGRYLFVSLIPVGLCIAVGLLAWVRLIFAKWTQSQWLIVLVTGAFAVFDLYVLFRIIIPALA